MEIYNTSSITNIINKELKNNYTNELEVLVDRTLDIYRFANKNCGFSSLEIFPDEKNNSVTISFQNFDYFLDIEINIKQFTLILEKGIGSNYKEYRIGTTLDIDTVKRYLFDFTNSKLNYLIDLNQDKEQINI